MLRAAGMRAASGLRCRRAAAAAAAGPAAGRLGAWAGPAWAAAEPARAQSTGFTPDQAEQFRKLAATVQANVAQGAAAMKAQFGEEFADKVRRHTGRRALCLSGAGGGG